MTRINRRATSTLTALAALLLVGVGPEGATAQVTTPPPPLQERPIEFPDFREVTLDNGLRVVILPYGTQPVMSANLYLPGGGALDPADRTGLASLTTSVLTRGTETRSAEEISEAIEGVGGSLNASAGQDFLTISTTALVDHMDVALELLQDVTLNATFPEEEVELARRQTLSGLQALLGQPQAVAQRRFNAVVYGEDHPYGRAPTPATVEAITRDELVAFRDEAVHAGGALLLVAGRVDPDGVEARIRELFGDWHGTERTLPAFVSPPDRDQARIYFVHRPGSVQSVFGVGHLGVQPDHPDYFALQVMNRILGGGADARLFQILREERGWTYGAYSQITRPADVGVIRAITEVRTDVSDSTFVELLHQFERLREETVPAEELDAARNYLAGSFPLRLETAGQVASQLAQNLLLGLPLEDVIRFPERIRAVTAEDVQRVARTHVHPDRAAIVVVADAGEALEQLEGRAPIQFFNIRGEPLTRDQVVGAGEPVAWDATRLREGMRRYDLYLQDNPLGAAEYTLTRDGDDWVSTAVIQSPAGSQETELRFSAEDFTPISLSQDLGQGPTAIRADLQVEDGRVVGEVRLPAQLGGDRTLDEPLGPGVLLPGMEELALAVAELEEGASFTIRIMDVIQGGHRVLEARVTGREEIQVPGGTFDTWRVELTGGDMPLTLYLHAEAPHVLIRQEFVGQPIRLDLTVMDPP